MRELTHSEIEEVSGGFGPAGAVLGAASGGIAGAMGDNGVGGIIAGAAFGAVAGFFGGIAGASAGFARYSFGTYSLGVGAMGTQSASGS